MSDDIIEIIAALFVLAGVAACGESATDRAAEQQADAVEAQGEARADQLEPLIQEVVADYDRRAATGAPTRPPSSPRTRGGAAARRGPDAGDHTHAAATGPDPGVGVLATPTDGQRHRPPLRVAPLDGAPEPPGWPASPTGRQRGHGGVVVGAHDGRVGSPSGHAPLPCLRGHLPDVHRIARPPDPGAPGS